jgi:hypothetical protein
MTVCVAPVEDEVCVAARTHVSMSSKAAAMHGQHGINLAQHQAMALAVQEGQSRESAAVCALTYSDCVRCT